MRFAVKVIDDEGNEMYLRHGARPGEGVVVSFPSREKAQVVAEDLRQNIGDEVRSVNVVAYPAE